LSQALVPSSKTSFEKKLLIKLMEVNEQLLALFVRDRSGFRTGKGPFAFSTDDTAIGFYCPFST
jgi:hypothetical protein